MSKLRPIIAKTPEDLAAAIGLTATDAREWQVQSVLSKRLGEIVRADGLTHAEVARRAGSSRTRITAILNGNLEHVTSDLLIRVISALGYRVKISIGRSVPQPKRRVATPNEKYSPGTKAERS